MVQVKLVNLENRYNKLSDDLWGEETGGPVACTGRLMADFLHTIVQWEGLAKVMHDLSRTNEVVATLKPMQTLVT